MFVILKTTIISLAIFFTFLSSPYAKKDYDAFWDSPTKEEEKLKLKKEDELNQKRSDAYHECMIKRVKSNSTEAHRLTVSAYCSNKANKIKN